EGGRATVSPSRMGSRPQTKRAEGSDPTSAIVEEKTFDDIKFDMEPSDEFVRDMLTPEIEALFGRKIRLRGYMLPTMRRAGIRKFVLVRDDQECCFGPGAALFDCVLIEMADGKTAEYSIRPVAVEGAFGFQELKDPVTKRHLAIFRMKANSVE
ncbi:MAG: DUF3299 domain-containing protein, partial [Planctomycetota bacterium]